MKRLLFVALVFAAFCKHDRLKHLAVPLWSKPAELAWAAAGTVAEAPGCELDKLQSLGARVTALLHASDGALWSGTFDRGVFRDGVPLPGNGRQQFVNALVEHHGSVWAATYGGVLEFDLDGAPRGVQLEGVAAEALVVHRDTLVVGTVRGLYRDFQLSGGADLRVTALTVNDDALWVGTSSGVYEERGTWHPLVFGPAASSTNVVLALAPFQRGVVALTDSGGLVDVQPGAEVRAMRFTEARANEGNAGAALVGDDGTLSFGTQGGGLLTVTAAGAARPKGWPLPVVSALAPGLVGDGDGDVYRYRCLTGPAAPSAMAGSLWESRASPALASRFPRTAR
ncbi:MAG: hypothetical protein IPJ65_38375 [Archangiaceae bacterium]|nr:hypothetical protein [Archangiaceae bacterium]